MVNNKSKKWQLFIKVISQLLNKEELKLRKLVFNPFLHSYKSNVLGSPEGSTVNLKTWERVKQLKRLITDKLTWSEKQPTDTFSLWNMIRDSLDPAHESERISEKENSFHPKIKKIYRRQQLNTILRKIGLF